MRTMHGGGRAPSCCAFTHRVAFEEGSGFSPGKEQAAGVWETCLAPVWPQLRCGLPFGPRSQPFIGPVVEEILLLVQKFMKLKKKTQKINL